MTYQSQKLRNLLLAQALRDCYEAGQTFAFVAVILDGVDDRAKAFYQRWDFAELQGNPFRLVLSSQTLTALMAAQPDIVEQKRIKETKAKETGLKRMRFRS